MNLLKFMKSNSLKVGLHNKFWLKMRCIAFCFVLVGWFVFIYLKLDVSSDFTRSIKGIVYPEKSIHIFKFHVEHYLCVRLSLFDEIIYWNNIIVYLKKIRYLIKLEKE